MDRNLNFHALQSTSRPLRSHIVRNLILVAVAILLFPLVLFGISVAFGEGVLMVISTGLIIGVPAVLKFIDLVKKPSSRLHEMYVGRVAEFAVANHARFIGGQRPHHGYGGTIFNLGSDKMITEAIHFQDGLEIGNYRHNMYVNELFSKERLHWGYVKIGLERHLPHMYIDARKNTPGLNYTVASRVDTLFPFDQNQKIRLEGGFNKYFTLYVPKQYERDALYVFTPDVMSALMSHGKKYDIEIIGNELYLYSEGGFPLANPEFYKQELPTFDTIRAEITKQANNYTNDRVPQGRALHVMTDRRGMLRTSSQIKSGLMAAGILLAFCAAYLLVMFLIVK